MSRIYAFAQHLAGLIAKDADVETFCRAKFSKSVTVWIGEDDREQPEITNCPLVVLTISGCQNSPDVEMGTRQIRFGLAIQDTSKHAANADGVMEYPGYPILIDFFELVQRVIDKARDPKETCEFSPVSGPDDSLEPPTFRAWFGISVNFDTDIN